MRSGRAMAVHYHGFMSNVKIKDLTPNMRERRAMSPAMALRLSRLFGNTPEFWLNAQRAYDLWQAQKSYQRDIKRIKPLRAA